MIFLLMVASIPAQELDLDKLDEVVPAAAVAKAPETVQPEKETAETAETAEPVKPAKKRYSILDLILSAGIIGHSIILLSFIAVAFVIEHAMTIRRKEMIPPGFADNVILLLNQGQLLPAIQKCKENPSVLAKILYAGMKEFELGWDAVEKGAEEATAEQTANLNRKVEYLNVIGNIAPMLGLLGTVVGMVFAFRQLAESEGFARAADLAEGIYLALVTTVEGLVVAIPALAAYSFFNNRIASLISETVLVAEQVLHPIKKSFIKRGDQSSRR